MTYVPFILSAGAKPFEVSSAVLAPATLLGIKNRALNAAEKLGGRAAAGFSFKEKGLTRDGPIRKN